MPRRRWGRWCLERPGNRSTEIVSRKGRRSRVMLCAWLLCSCVYCSVYFRVYCVPLPRVGLPGVMCAKTVVGSETSVCGHAVGGVPLLTLTFKMHLLAEQGRLSVQSAIASFLYTRCVFFPIICSYTFTCFAIGGQHPRGSLIPACLPSCTGMQILASTRMRSHRRSR